MRGVDPDGSLRFSFQAYERAGLRAVPVQDVKFERSRKAKKMQRCHAIGRMRLAADGKAMDPELELRADLLEGGFCAFSASEAIGENADLMSALGLSHGEIEDMTEYAADRRADSV